MPIPSFPNPNPGDTIAAAWGQGVYADIAAHDADKLAKDGSIPIAGSLTWSTHNTHDLATPTTRIRDIFCMSIQADTASNAGRYQVGGIDVIGPNKDINAQGGNFYMIDGTTIADASRNLLNIAGLGNGTTTRKLATLDNNWHGVFQFGNYYLTTGSYANGATEEMTFNFVGTPPGTIFAVFVTVKCVTAGQTGGTFSAHVTAWTGTTFTVRCHNNTGIEIPAADVTYQVAVISQV